MEDFGIVNGRQAHLYTLKNEALIVKVTDYGAAMVSIIARKTGIDILLGFDSAEGYEHNGSHIGGFIGRTANRTKNASFELNGKTYHITANENGNNLHGGKGFDRRFYDVEEKNNELVFHRTSLDGEEGYPGNLDVKVRYILNENVLTIKAEGTALDQDTLFAFTNHNYYNLNGEGDIYSYDLKINADQYAPNDNQGISEEKLKSVEETDFDFRKFTKISRAEKSQDPQIIKNRYGYDHHFAVNGTGMREFSKCRGSKLELDVSSDLPGMHVYTANFLDEPDGKKGIHYQPHTAICFEPEFLPNAINYASVKEKPIVKKGETSVHSIVLTINEL